MTSPELTWKIMEDLKIDIEVSVADLKAQGDRLAVILQFELGRLMTSTAAHEAQRIATRVLEGSGWVTVVKADKTKLHVELTPLLEPINLNLKV